MTFEDATPLDQIVKRLNERGDALSLSAAEALEAAAMHLTMYVMKNLRDGPAIGGLRAAIYQLLLADHLQRWVDDIGETYNGGEGEAFMLEFFGRTREAQAVREASNLNRRAS